MLINDENANIRFTMKYVVSENEFATNFQLGKKPNHVKLSRSQFFGQVSDMDTINPPS